MPYTSGGWMDNVEIYIYTESLEPTCLTAKGFILP